MFCHTNWIDENTADKNLIKEPTLAPIKSDCNAVLAKSPKSSKRLTKDQEYELAHKAMSGDINARNELISANYGLVYKLVHDYTGAGDSFKDLYQEGCVGLIMAANKFDPQKNCRFSTYATFWIKKYISRSSIRSGFSTKIPRRLEPYINKVLSFSKLFEVTNLREPTTEEIAEGTCVPLEIVYDVLHFSKPPLEYDDRTFPTSNNHCSPTDSDNEDAVIAVLMKQEFAEIFEAVLNDLEKYILRALFCNDVRVTKKSLAQQLHITVPQITNIEKRAFKKIRNYFLENNLDVNDYL